MNETGLDLGVPVGVSGAFLYDKLRFSEIQKLSTEFYRLNSQVGEMESKLLYCNDPQWLHSFERRCCRLGLDPKQELIAQADSLETRKAVLTEQMDEVRQKLLALESRRSTPTTLLPVHLLCIRIPDRI